MVFKGVNKKNNDSIGFIYFYERGHLQIKYKLYIMYGI